MNVSLFLKETVVGGFFLHRVKADSLFQTTDSWQGLHFPLNVIVHHNMVFQSSVSKMAVLEYRTNSRASAHVGFSITIYI